MESSVKSKKIALLFIFVSLFFVIFITAVFYRIVTERKLPTLETSKIDTAIRGSIYSKDGFRLAASKKLYKAVVNTNNIDPNKKDLFVKLFSIYSKIPADEIKKILKNSKGQTVLSYNIDSKTAKNLKELAIKLNSLGVFIEYEDKATKKSYKHGLSILESGEKRVYGYDDACEPILGYVKKDQENELTRAIGVKGIEKFYEEYLAPKQDGYVEGTRDVGFNLIFNKETKEIDRIDGFDIYLNISLKTQKKLERILDKAQKKLGVKEIIAAVMDSKSSDIIAIASSARFNPNSIDKDDYKYLNPSFVEYPFEPGSVIKPVVFAILLDKKLINPSDIINLYNGRYQLKNKIITDTHKEASSTIEDVIVYSSNIGMAQIAQKLTPQDYYKSLLSFGFAQKSGIDLALERVGAIPTIGQLKDEIYKATVAYGYGMQANFIQLLNAYNVFNNDGLMGHPMIAYMIEDAQGNRALARSVVIQKEKTQIISPQTAKKMKQILIKTVEQGTGVAAKVDGLEIGGKTGTAHIAKGGEYVRLYNSSFFGFANDENNRFTIGVVAFELDSDVYFASQTAAPIFKEIVELLIQDKYLTPTKSLEQNSSVTKQNSQNQMQQKRR